MRVALEDEGGTMSHSIGLYRLTSEWHSELSLLSSQRSLLSNTATHCSSPGPKIHYGSFCPLTSQAPPLTPLEFQGPGKGKSGPNACTAGTPPTEPCPQPTVLSSLNQIPVKCSVLAIHIFLPHLPGECRLQGVTLLNRSQFSSLKMQHFNVVANDLFFSSTGLGTQSLGLFSVVSLTKHK